MNPDIKTLHWSDSFNNILFKLDVAITSQGDPNIAIFSQISHLSRTLKLFLR